MDSDSSLLSSEGDVTKEVMTLDELSTALSPLYEKYYEPLDDLSVVPNEETNRRCLAVFSLRLLPLSKKFGTSDSIDDLDFHMSTSAKYLLVSAFLASRNPDTLELREIKGSERALGARYVHERPGNFSIGE
ncbi:origin of replication complex subunit 5, partial [Tanacetum coccineum]